MGHTGTIQCLKKRLLCNQHGRKNSSKMFFLSCSKRAKMKAHAFSGICSSMWSVLKITKSNKKVQSKTLLSLPHMNNFYKVRSISAGSPANKSPAFIGVITLWCKVSSKTHCLYWQWTQGRKKRLHGEHHLGRSAEMQMGGKRKTLLHLLLSHPIQGDAQ